MDERSYRRHCEPKKKKELFFEKEEEKKIIMQATNTYEKEDLKTAKFKKKKR